MRPPLVKSTNNALDEVSSSFDPHAHCGSGSCPDLVSHPWGVRQRLCTKHLSGFTPHDVCREAAVAVATATQKLISRLPGCRPMQVDGLTAFRTSPVRVGLGSGAEHGKTLRVVRGGGWARGGGPINATGCRECRQGQVGSLRHAARFCTGLAGLGSHRWRQLGVRLRHPGP